MHRIKRTIVYGSYALFLLPLIALAQSPSASGDPVLTLRNPLGDVTLQQFLLKILDIILLFAVPIIVFFIILAGFKYVTAGGNTESIKKATTALTWALIGGVLILGARVILDIIQNTVQSLRN